MMRAILFAVCLLAVPGVAHAYIGPGLGAGTVAAVLGVFGSIVLALFAVIYYPIKRMRKRKKRAATTNDEAKSLEA